MERPDRLPAPLPFVPKDGVLDVELSQYAGYAGLILANGGLAPNPESWITKTHGVKLRLTLSEEDCWPALNSGRLAASSTTVDVLPLYGKAFDVVVPAQFCFSRGADGIVVRKEIRQINNLRGKVLSSARFNETEFFLRYLAQEAGIPVHAMPSADSPPEADKINLLYCEDAEVAAQAFLSDLQNKGGLLAGCVSWAPFTTETVEAAGGAARLLVDSRNLLIVSDVLVMNKGFAQANPPAVAALTEAITWGNTQLRADVAPHVPLLAKALGWTEPETREELAKIHFSNLPESVAFFEGSIDSAGSFESIFQSSLLAYGSGVNPNPVSSSWFLDLKPLQAIAAKPEYALSNGRDPPHPLLGRGFDRKRPAADPRHPFLFPAQQRRTGGRQSQERRVLPGHRQDAQGVTRIHHHPARPCGRRQEGGVRARRKGNAPHDGPASRGIEPEPSQGRQGTVGERAEDRGGPHRDRRTGLERAGRQPDLRSQATRGSPLVHGGVTLTQ
jgi:hypothetical protein